MVQLKDDVLEFAATNDPFKLHQHSCLVKPSESAIHAPGARTVCLRISLFVRQTKETRDAEDVRLVAPDVPSRPCLYGRTYGTADLQPKVRAQRNRACALFSGRRFGA